MNARAKTVERATEVAMLLCELAAADVVVEALLKGTAHKVPKLALASTDALRLAVAEFGTPKVVPPKPILKGMSHLFDSKDAKIRGAAKDLTVELTRWLGPDAVKRDLLDKMRDTMQAEVREMMGQPGNAPGAARPTRRTRAEQANPPPEPMDVDGGDRGVAGEATGAGAGESAGDATASSAAAGEGGALPDAYEYADPEIILEKLDKAPPDKEQPKFWDAIVSTKWKERLGALSQLKELADCPKLAPGDYGDVARALKKVVTKDANIACVGEAVAAAGNLARSARKEWSREARIMLPGMLDKLKDKNTSVVARIHDALLQFVRHCFVLGDATEEVAAALGHKVPKVAEQTLQWVALASGELLGGRAAALSLVKTLLPAVVKCADAATPDVRAAALEAIAGIARAAGGGKAVAKIIDALDDAKKRKIEELCSSGGESGGEAGGGSAEPLTTRDSNGTGVGAAAAAKPPAAVRSSVTGALVRPGTSGEGGASTARGRPRPGTSSGAGTGAGTARGSKPASSKQGLAKAGLSKAATSGASVSSSSVEEAEMTEGPPASKEELVERMSALYTAVAVGQLQSGEWKQRLAGITDVADAVAAMSPEGASGVVVDTTVRGLAVFPGFDDKNFQVLTKVFEVFGALAAKFAAFTRRDGAQCVAGMAEKVADVKLRAPAYAALTSIAEALGPKFVMAQLHRRAAAHKNPKVAAEALLWCAGAVTDFGTTVVDVTFTIAWCKDALGQANPGTKAAAGKVLGAMHGGLGPGLRGFLSDLKEVQLKTLEAEFARNPYVGAGAGADDAGAARKVRVVEEAAGGEGEDEGGGGGGGGGGGLPRTDVSGRITGKLIKDMSDHNWKVRAAAVEEVGTILTEANHRIAPQTGELMGALAQRFGDSNRNLAASALAMTGRVAEAMGAAVGERRHGHGLVPDLVKQMGDSKTSVRAAAAGALDAWSNAAGLGKVLPHVADKLLEVAAKMSADGKADALSWVLAALTGPAGEDGVAGDLDLAPVLAAAAVGLGDKATQARTAGGKLLDEVTRRVGSDATLRLCAAAAMPPALKKAALTHVERGGAVVGASAPNSLTPSPATSPGRHPGAGGGLAGMGMRAGSAGAGASTARGGASGLRSSVSGAGIATARGGALGSGAGANARASLSASRSGALTSRGGVGASTTGSLAGLSASAAASASGPVLHANDDKEARLKRLPKKPVKFEVLRDDQLKLAEDDLKLALAPYVRADVHALLFKDFKAHIQALEHLSDGALAESPALVPGNLDLMLRWVVLRLCEQAPNTQSLLRVLDFVAATLAVVKDQGVRLSEQECALFLPALVDKCGHPMEAVREKFRKVLRTIPGLFAASRLVGYLVRGLDSKNTKTRLEVLDALGSLLERHGLDVVERGGSKALAEVAKLCDARDTAMRTAAMSCLVTAYKVGGADTWKHVGRPSDLVKSALEDKFAKAAKEMERKREGQPGAWVKGGALVGGGATGAAAVTVGAVPMPAGLMGRAVSRSIAAPGRLAPSTLHSPLVAPSQPLQQNAAAATVTTAPFMPALSVAEPEPGSMAARLAGWKLSLVAVGSVSDPVAVEGMKALCHEVMAAVTNPPVLEAMAGDADRLVGLLAERVPPIFEAAAAAPGPSTTRACKYVLNTLMQVYQEPALAGAVSEENERETVAVLLERLLDPSVPRLEEGPQLVKALNVLMLKVLEHCPRTSSFRALLRLLRRAPPAVAEDPALAAKFHDLVVKCLIKLTKALGATLAAVHLPTLLADIHDFFHGLGVEEIRRRSQTDDKPLRMVKTILHEVTKLVGHDIHASLGACPPRTADPPPVIYAYVDLNLQSMPDALGAAPQHAPSAPVAGAPARAIGATPQAWGAAPKTVTPVRATPTAAAPSTESADRTSAGRVRTPPKTSPLLAKPSPPWAASRQRTSPPAAAATDTTTPAAAGRWPAGGGDVEMHPATPTDVVMRPPTPVSAELKSELAGVFKMIGEKTSTIQGLERLFDFSRAHPGVDIQPHLARTSVAFQNYIKKGLSKVEVARAEKAATHPQGPFEAGASDSGAGGTVAAARRGAPLVAPSPMPQMEKSAAEVYRERLARMQATKETGVSTASGMGAGSSARVAARVPARAASAGAGARSGSSAASAGLTTLRERMDRIAAKAAGAGPAGGAGAAGGSLGNGSNGSGGGIGSGSPRVPRRMVDVNQVEVLQARMERIKAGRVEGGTQG